MTFIVAESTADVIAAVDHARRRGLPLAVSARPVDGAGPVDGVVVDLSGLAGVEVDPSAGTATVAGGTTWAPVLAAAGHHALAPVLADDVEAGVVADVLGGGFGWLARLHGRTRDLVRAAEVVTVDGELVRTTPTEHPDLLRALRRGSTPGVAAVTSLSLCLVPVGDVYAGELRYPLTMVPEVLARYATWVTSLPAEMTSAVVLDGAAGERAAAVVRGCFAGPPEHGLAMVAAWRRWAEPVADRFAVRPFATIADIGDPVGSARRTVVTEWLRGLSDEVTAVLLAGVLPGDDSGAALRAEVRHLAGALARGAGAVPPETTDLLLLVAGTAPTVAGGPTVSRRLGDLRRALAARDAISPSASGPASAAPGW